MSIQEQTDVSATEQWTIVVVKVTAILIVFECRRLVYVNSADTFVYLCELCRPVIRHSSWVLIIGFIYRCVR
jgi:hypothetical protein